MCVYVYICGCSCAPVLKCQGCRSRGSGWDMIGEDIGGGNFIVYFDAFDIYV